MIRKLVLILFFVLPLAAQAENLELKYEAAWSGIKAGTAEVVINETAASYNDRVRADAVGIVKELTNYWTDSMVSGAIMGSQYQPAVFDSKWQPKKAPTQRVVVTYVKGGAVNEVATPPENRKKRPVVAPNIKHGLPDPISAGMMARRKAQKIIESGAQLPQDFKLRIFDSRRVTDLNFTIAGYEQVNFGGKSQKLLKVIFTRTPVTGYNEKELRLHHSLNPVIYIYADKDYVPVYAVGQAIIGQVTIKLVGK